MPRYKLFSRKLWYSSCWNVKRFLMCGKLFHLIHGRDRKNRSSTARNSSSRWCDVTSIIYWAEIVFRRWQLSEGIVTFLQETENNLGSDISNYSNFGITKSNQVWGLKWSLKSQTPTPTPTSTSDFPTCIPYLYHLLQQDWNTACIISTQRSNNLSTTHSTKEQKHNIISAFNIIL